MVERLSTVKVDASKVQGDGAFVLWRRMTWGERKAYAEAAKSGDLSNLSMILNHVIGWNWIDADGQPLELPKQETDFDALYEEEIVFLAGIATRALQGRLELTQEAEKN